MYIACMGQVIQVRNVPDEVHRELTQQATNAGLSLNRFLLTELERIARRGRNQEIFARARRRPGRRPTSAEIVQAIREIRDES